MTYLVIAIITWPVVAYMIYDPKASYFSYECNPIAVAAASLMLCALWPATLSIALIAYGIARLKK